MAPALETHQRQELQQRRELQERPASLRCLLSNLTLRKSWTTWARVCPVFSAAMKPKPLYFGATVHPHVHPQIPGPGDQFKGVICTKSKLHEPKYLWFSLDCEEDAFARTRAGSTPATSFRASASWRGSSSSSLPRTPRSRTACPIVTLSRQPVSNNGNCHGIATAFATTNAISPYRGGGGYSMHDNIDIRHSNLRKSTY